MGAQLPEAEAGGAAATLAVAPTVAEPSARRGWTRNLDVIIPSALIGLLLFLCFVWPLFGTVPPPTGGNILDANLPSFSSGHPLGTDQVGNDLWSRLLYGGRNSLEIAFAVNVIGLVVGGLLGAFAALLGVVHRHRDHARPRRADRVPVARPGAGHRAEPRAQQAAHDLRAVLLQRAGLRPSGAGADPAPARAAVHARRAAGGHARAADPAAPHHAEHPARARHVRAARRGRDDHPRGRAELPRPRHPAPRAELGEHDLRGAGRPLGRAQARAAAERLPVRHRAGLQPPRRRAARARATRRDARRSPGRRPRRGRHRSRRAGPLLEVHDLRVDFHLGGRHRPRRRRPQLRAPGRAHAGDHRRVGLGQDRQLAGDHGAAAPQRDGLRLGALRAARSCSASPTRRCAATAARTSRWSSRTRRGR